MTLRAKGIESGTARSESWSNTVTFLRAVERALDPVLSALPPYKGQVVIQTSKGADDYEEKWRGYLSNVEKATADMASFSRHLVDRTAVQHCNNWINALRRYSQLIVDSINDHRALISAWQRREEFGGDNIFGEWFQKFLGIDKLVRQEKLSMRRQLLARQREHEKMERNLAALCQSAKGLDQR